jgi:hypothetical protein
LFFFFCDAFAMILLVAMALLGALLGAFLRPRLISPFAAVALTEVLHIWMGLTVPLLPLIGASGGAALIAAVLMMTRRDKSFAAAPLNDAAAQRRVRKGRYVRDPDMIEERPAQIRAEARQKALLGL